MSGNRWRAGSITRWLSEVVGSTGRVIATDLQLGFLTEIVASNVEILQHDIRTDTFPPGTFDLIHTRAVLMHISPSVDLLRRVVAWLAPGGWLVLEGPDFGMWIGDADPVWATFPQTTQVAFPSQPAGAHACCRGSVPSATTTRSPNATGRLAKRDPAIVVHKLAWLVVAGYVPRFHMECA